METPLISAIVLVGNFTDKTKLTKCLASLSWCDEVIKFETKSVKGNFSDWRNAAAKQAHGKWLLYIDADEVVTKDLEKEIKENIKMDKYAAFAIPRRNFIFGREMKHIGLYPDYVLRLMKKNKLIGWKGELHEQPQIDGKIKHLSSPLIHDKHSDLASMVDKTNQWSEIEAKLMFDAGHPKMNFFRFFSAAFREFWLRVVLQKAYLDGIEGIIYGLYQVFSRIISYSKLWELQLKNEGSNL